MVDASFIAIDSTPISANTNQSNSKSFAKDKFDPENHPKNDPDCKLGVHTVSNQHNEKKYKFFWGYKSHVAVDCITGLPLCELITTAEVAAHVVVIDLLEDTNDVIPAKECTLIADKGYDTKKIYNTAKNVYDGNYVIPLNPRNKKQPKMTVVGNIVCEAGFAMHKDGKDPTGGRLCQKYCCPFKHSKDDSACTYAHKNYFNGKKNRGCTKFVTLLDDYRLSIDYSCISLKRFYAMRIEIERYNAKFKKMRKEHMWAMPLS